MSEDVYLTTSSMDKDVYMAEYAQELLNDDALDPYEAAFLEGHQQASDFS